MPADKIPTPEAVNTQLAHILQSAEFRGSEKQKNFLRFIIDETLAGRASQLKGYTIAVTAYGRDENFDPQTDPIVRVEAGRLRRALANYYLTAGKNDPLRITIPKGAYVPVFEPLHSKLPKNQAVSLEKNGSDVFTGSSIAVLPLLNMNDDEDQDYFADGLTEELTTELSRYQELQVIASQSTMRFKGRQVDPERVGKELGVRFLLTGRIRKDLKTVKVAIQLIDASTAVQIWEESHKHDLTADSLIALEEEIAQGAVGVIADQYGLISRRLSRESRKKAPADLRVFDAILRFYQYETELTPEAFKTALAALEQAVEIDPEYGLAWAMLGHLHADNYALGFVEIDAPLEKALTFAKKGVALAPENQFARDALTLVYFHRGDKRLFLKNAELTIALNPNAPYIVGVAGWHMGLCGEWDRGLALLKKGMKLNPYHPTWFHLMPFMDFYRRGLYEDALAEALEFNYPEMFWDPLMRAAALGQLGRTREAGAAIGELLSLEPEFTSRARQLIHGYVKNDDLIEKIIEGLQKAGLDNLK